MIPRGIVTIADGQVKIGPPAPNQVNAGSITAEQFFSAMADIDRTLPARLKDFLRRLDDLGVNPTPVVTKLNGIRHPGGRSILAHISRNGEIWTDAVHWNVSDRSTSQAYIEELANGWAMRVEKLKLPPNWHVRQGERVPRINVVANKLDIWIAAIERFQNRIREQNELSPA